MNTVLKLVNVVTRCLIKNNATIINVMQAQCIDTIPYRAGWQTHQWAKKERLPNCLSTNNRLTVHQCQKTEATELKHEQSPASNFHLKLASQ